MESVRQPLLPVALRILAFRATREEFLGLDRRHLAFGLLCTWVVGMGRSWDDPQAGLVRHLGVGSVLYVFVLAFLLWASANPLLVKRISYLKFLTFVCLTSPPAILYAIPVEMFVKPATASALNLLLLCIVASWRVALLISFLRKGAGMRAGEIFVATTFPLATILVPISLFGMTEAVVSAMGGLREEQTPNDLANLVLFLIGNLAFWAWLPLAIALITMQRSAAEKRAEMTRDQP